MSTREPRRRAARPCAIVLPLLLGLAGPALATPADEPFPALVVTASGPLQARTEVQALVVEERSEDEPVRRFVPAERLQAGEEVYYTIRVTNPGSAPVHDIVVTRRLPYGVDYVRGSAVGPDCKILFSTDGSTFVAAPRQGTYTHVRWILRQPLVPGATALLRFRAIFR
ncbi:MAG: hypothetical protein U1F09_05930 [Steroidobacteraceae bacterium]